MKNAYFIKSYTTSSKIILSKVRLIGDFPNETKEEFEFQLSEMVLLLSIQSSYRFSSKPSKPVKGCGLKRFSIQFPRKFLNNLAFELIFIDFVKNEIGDSLSNNKLNLCAIVTFCTNPQNIPILWKC